MATGEKCCCPVIEDILFSPGPIRAKGEWRVGTKHSRGFVPRSAAALAQVSAQGAQQQDSTPDAACLK